MCIHPHGGFELVSAEVIVSQQRECIPVAICFALEATELPCMHFQEVL